MRVEFDPAKDAANQAKHGVSLALAVELDWEAALVWFDARFDYEELRVIGLVPKTDWFPSIFLLEINLCQ